MTAIVKFNGVTVATSYRVVDGRKVVFWDFRDQKWVSVPKDLFDQTYRVGGELELVRTKKKSKGKKRRVKKYVKKQIKKNNKSRKNRRTKAGSHKKPSKPKTTLHCYRAGWG